MDFETVRLRMYPEAGGFVLLDPARLDAFYGGNSAGRDILTELSTTEAGDRVSEDGIAIPIVMVEDGDYTIVVRTADSPGLAPEPRLRSAGWILGTETGDLVCCGVGSLLIWDPRSPRLVHVRVPPGWYRVAIQGHVLNEGQPAEEWAYEFVLTQAEGQPPFSADLSEDLSLAPE